MIENVEKQDNMKTQEGIGLYKISYEMDVKGSSKEQSYIAGVIAYTSKEAIDTLVNFAKKRVKGFKGMKINEVSFDGSCHAISDSVRNAIVNNAVAEGIVVDKETHKMMLKDVKGENAKALKKATAKKSILKDKE